MYQYDDYDRALVRERVAQFRDQVQRRLADELSEEEFLPLRLQNGLYLQKHAYMLRVAIPYGTLSAKQMRALAHIAREYDRGYGHFTTRQNIQFNWVELERVPDILDWLAEHDMHARDDGKGQRQRNRVANGIIEPQHMRNRQDERGHSRFTDPA